jgi:hypothetical protein
MLGAERHQAAHVVAARTSTAEPVDVMHVLGIALAIGLPSSWRSPPPPGRHRKPRRLARVAALERGRAGLDAAEDVPNFGAAQAASSPSASTTVRLRCSRTSRLAHSC